jgi:hypothetical protein
MYDSCCYMAMDTCYDPRHDDGFYDPMSFVGVTDYIYSGG